MTEATEAARQIAAELENKLAAAEARAVELQTERRRLSFAANTGDGAAEKRLKALNTEAAHINLDIENVRSAIDEAKRRLAVAERDEAMGKARENANEAVKLAAELAQLGHGIDADFASGCEKLERSKSIIDRLHQLGITHPRGEQVKVLSGLALATHLMLLPIRAERDHLAPHERHTFEELYSGWARGVTNQVAPLLGEQGEEAA